LKGEGVHIFGEAGFDKGAGGGGGRCAPSLGLSGVSQEAVRNRDEEGVIKRE